MVLGGKVRGLGTQYSQQSEQSTEDAMGELLKARCGKWSGSELCPVPDAAFGYLF